MSTVDCMSYMYGIAIWVSSVITGKIGAATTITSIWSSYRSYYINNIVYIIMY